MESIPSRGAPEGPEGPAPRPEIRRLAEAAARALGGAVYPESVVHQGETLYALARDERGKKVFLATRMDGANRPARRGPKAGPDR